MTTPFISYGPALAQDLKDRFASILSYAAMQPSGITRARLIDLHLKRVALQGEVPLEYQAALLFARDLLAQGWRVKVQDGQPQFGHPVVDKRQDSKEGLRQALLLERNKQLREPSVSAFVRRMERERTFKGKKVSVLSLVADTDALVSSAKTLGVSALQPYLQLVGSDKDRDEFTGMRLLDIWRYFRLTWALPYKSTPGRNMFYLVRDAGQPGHPVMGIAALGSSIVQITPRDERIGWTVESLRARFQRSVTTHRYDEQLPDRAGTRCVVCHESNETESEFQTRIEKESAVVLDAMTNAVDRAIQDVNPVGLLSTEELQDPSEEAIHRLLVQADATTQSSPPRRVDSASSDEVWAEECQSSLYVKKRCKTLAALLRARLVLRSTRDASYGHRDQLRTLLSTSVGRSVLSTAIHAAKKERVGANMMDIIVCGAVPPYNHLLAGKLVALLMTSSEVTTQYQQRYQDQVSIIASCMKGQRVVKDSHLVFLGTTSLYETGSSQYNRLKLPVSELPGEADGQIEYENLGLTKGFGSVYVSDETVEVLGQLVQRTHGSRVVHNTYGEGTSPRLRLIRLGLDALGLQSEELMRHNYRRIVYGVKLARNGYEYLRGEESVPDYFLSHDNPKEVTEKICEYWRTRWLSMRLANETVIEKIKQFTIRDLKLGQLL